MADNFDDKCVLCQNPAELNRPWDAAWNKKCAESICKLLDINRNDFSCLFENPSYCSPCHEFIRDIDFTLRAMARLEEKCKEFRTILSEMLLPNFERLWALSRRESNDNNEGSPVEHMDLDEAQITETESDPVNGVDVPNIVTILDIKEEAVNPVAVEYEYDDEDMDHPEFPEFQNGLVEEPEIIFQSSTEQAATTSTANGAKRKGRPAKKSKKLRTDQSEDEEKDSDFKPETTSSASDGDNDDDLQVSVSDDNTEDSAISDSEGSSDKSGVRHIRVKKPSRGKSLKCDQCSKKFSQAYLLTYHKARHHTLPVVSTCPICVKSFASKHILLTHMKRIHRDTEEFACKTCKTTFILEDDCNAHEKLHEPNSFTCVLGTCYLDSCKEVKLKTTAAMWLCNSILKKFMLNRNPLNVTCVTIKLNIRQV